MTDVLPKVTEVGLKILFLLIPGIIAFFVVKAVGPKRPRTDFESGLQIFLYGIFAYALAGVIEGLYAWAVSHPRHAFWATLGERSLELATLNPKSGLGAGQILLATLVAMGIGLLIAFLQTRSVPHRVLQKLGISKRTGEIDMWGFTFNSPNLDSWVTVRHPNGKVYQGWVRGYSDGDSHRELLLADVKVYQVSAANSDVAEVDSIPTLYLGLDPRNCVVEFQLIRAQESSDGEQAESARHH